MFKTRRQRATDRGDSGQALVEFALVMPILLILFAGLVELALAFNAFIATNRASQHGGHLAAILGNEIGADCAILQAIEADIAAPNDPNKIIEVLIERTALAGNRTLGNDVQTWIRSGSSECPQGSGVFLPYTRATDLYPEGQRCAALAGCPGMTPPRSTVDNIGVSVKYRHVWATPLNSILNVFAGGDTGWTFTQQNIFRMEPAL